MPKISSKLPLSDELITVLCSMSDVDAGAVFKAALTYMAGGEPPVLPAAAHNAFDSMRRLIDLSRKRAQAGKIGSGVGGQNTRFAPGKRDFAPSNTIFAPDKQNPPDVLSGLDAFS